jgi:hypothetical protein
MIVIDPFSFHADLDKLFGFTGFEPGRKGHNNVKIIDGAPHQSKGKMVRFPGSSLAAEELGVSRSHLHRVLIGERSSPPLRGRWQAWLQTHPEFAALQPSDRPA